MTFDDVVNFPDPNQKQRFLNMCGVLDKPHVVTIAPYSKRRSTQANRYYFGTIVKALCDFQREQGEVWSKDRAHGFIVGEVLGMDEVIHPITGEVKHVRKETHGMSTEQFSEFIDLAHSWLANWGFNVQTRAQFEGMEAAV